MGASVSSLQILGVPEDTVRDALPGALVGTWSKRFVTACLGPDFMETERKARSLSKKLQCTVLAASLIDGDTLRLMLYQSGKNLTYHIALPKYGTHKAGNSALFCSVLGLPEALAPKLKRLLAGCEIQEEKLGILQALLGAPLLIHCGEILGEAVKEDSGPLENWIRERLAPLKIKNRYKAELIQEIPDRHPEFTLALRSGTLILRPAVRGEDRAREYVIERTGDILGYACAGGEWARPLPDGRLELVPLADPDTADRFDTYLYAQSEDRLVTAAVLHGPDPSGFPGAYKPTQTVIVHDTAGILPCPLPLTLENSPATGTFTLLPDGGFLAEICPQFDGSRPPVQIREPALACYGPDGTQRWTAEGVARVVRLEEGRICAVMEDDSGHPECLLVLDMDGAVMERTSDAASLDAACEGAASVPNTTATDGQGNLWMCAGSYFSCYTPELECISRHRLKGKVCQVYRNETGQVCAVTFQPSKYIIRVYRFRDSTPNKS